MIRQIILIAVAWQVLCQGGQGVDFSNPFNNIYRTKRWNPRGGPLSGMGSDACRYMRYLLLLQHIVDIPGVKDIVQIGFGDFEMNQHIIFENKRYRGYDVVQTLLRKSSDYMQFNILKDLKQLQRGGDLLIVKDVMQHWRNSEVQYLIDNILPKFKYALITNDMIGGNMRRDTTVGGHSPIPVQWLPDSSQLLSISDQMAHVTKATYLYRNPNDFFVAV